MPIFAVSPAKTAILINIYIKLAAIWSQHVCYFKHYYKAYYMALYPYYQTRVFTD